MANSGEEEATEFRDLNTGRPFTWKLRGGLTQKERDVLERALVCKSLTEVAARLGVRQTTVSERKSRLELRYLKAKVLVNEYEFYRVKLAQQGKMWLQ